MDAQRRPAAPSSGSASVVTMRNPAQRTFWPWTGVVYWLLLVGAAILVACAPTVVLVPWLVADVSNIPLLALLLVPVGPAVAAAVFAWDRRRADPDHSPLRQYARGYRLNLGDALRVWLPVLALLTVLGINITHSGAVRGGPVLGAVSLVLALLVTLWAGHALVITALFNFRWRDTARLAAYHLGASWRTTLSVLSLLVVTVGAILVAGWLLLFLAAPLTFFLHSGAAPMSSDVKTRFTTSEDP